MSPSIYDFEATSKYKDKNTALLIVNTASKCGYTPQYKDLQKLYTEYKDKGLEILAFPCNQFGGQEPGTEEEIHQFCELNFGVTFPILKKVDVNGKAADPLFVHLKEVLPGVLGTTAIKWNFTKFLIDASGKPIVRLASADSYDAMKKAIDGLNLNK